MRVLMIDHMLPENTYTEELCRQLGARTELTLLTTRYYHPGQESFRCKSVFETRIKSGRAGLLRYVWGLVRQYVLVLFSRCDVMHVQTFKRETLEMPLYLLAKRLGRRKLVYTAHNILPHEHDGASKAETRLRSWYRACDAIMVHNEQSRQVLLDFAPECAGKVYVIAHGTFHAFSGAQAALPHEKTVFLQFGQLRKYKGVDILLRAAALLPKETREKIRIVIAGKQWKNLDDSDYEGMLDENGLRDFVEFRNDFIPDEEVPAYFNTADCCLFPYRDIYGSGALLMAYTFGVPVIASGIPAFVEETEGGKTGLLYEPGDEQSFADAIRRFTELSEAERQAMKARIRALCENKYNWAVSAERLTEVYQALLR